MNAKITLEAELSVLVDVSFFTFILLRAFETFFYYSTTSNFGCVEKKNVYFERAFRWYILSSREQNLSRINKYKLWSFRQFQKSQR